MMKNRLRSKNWLAIAWISWGQTLPVTSIVYRSMANETKQTIMSESVHFSLLSFLFTGIFMAEFLQCANKIDLHDVNALRFQLIEFAAGFFRLLFMTELAINNSAVMLTTQKFDFDVCVIHEYCQSMQIPQCTCWISNVSADILFCFAFTLLLNVQQIVIKAK